MVLSRRFHIRYCLHQQSKTKSVFRVSVCLMLIMAVVGCSLYTIDWNVHISMKPWLRYWGSSPTSDSFTIATTSSSQPYPSCFQPPYTAPIRESPPLTPGVPLIRLDECLGFAKSISSASDHLQSQNDSIWFHTYWKDVSQTNSDSAAQLLTMLRSFSATHSGHLMKIWVQDEHDETLLLHSDTWRLAKQHMERQKQELTYGVWTKMTVAAAAAVVAKDQDWNKNTMDYIGLHVLQHYGGVWFHPSTVFLRDWSPLIGQREWMIQHDCEATHTGHGSLIIDNGHQQRTMMHFFANSSLLCQLIESINNGRTTDLGQIYKSVYRSMIQNSIRPWSLLPWCFMNVVDGCSSTNTNDFRLFEKPKSSGHDAATLVGESGAFALQYDANQWNSEPGTLLNLLDQAHRIKAGW